MPPSKASPDDGGGGICQDEDEDRDEEEQALRAGGDEEQADADRKVDFAKRGAADAVEDGAQIAAKGAQIFHRQQRRYRDEREHHHRPGSREEPGKAQGGETAADVEELA